MQIIETKAYSYDELEPTAQEKARDWWREDEEFDSDFIIEDAKAVAALMGLEIKDVYWSGFWSQGDGACFTGRYAYRKCSLDMVKAYAPQDAELSRIAKALTDLQRVNFYRLQCGIYHNGHYYHERSMRLDIDYRDALTEKAEDELKDIFADFALWIYQQLEREHEYTISDEVVAENIRANGYLFDSEGGFIK